MFNLTLEGIYSAYGVPVADVAGTFMSDRLDDNNGNGIPDSLDDNDGNGLPDSVDLLCAWTWMCLRQNIHPNEAGYEAIAAAYAAVLPEIPISGPPRRR